jgi:hypothetical protein
MAIEVIWRTIGRVYSAQGESVLIDAPLVPIAAAEWWRFEFYGALLGSAPKRIRVVLGADPAAGKPGVALVDYGPVNAELAYQVLAVVANQGAGVYFAAVQLNLGGTVPGRTDCFVIAGPDIARHQIQLIANSNVGEVVNGIFIARKEWQSAAESEFLSLRAGRPNV